MSKPPRAPTHLSKRAKSLWKDIVGAYVLPPDALALLQAALESWDSYQQAREVLVKEGPTVTNPETGNVRAHPAASVANGALREFRLSMKQLGLEPPEPEPENRR